MWRIGKKLETKAVVAEGVPDWKQADAGFIESALAHSQTLPSGGWFVIGDSRKIGVEPRAIVIDGKELVVWRTSEGVHAAPNSCPHMGAKLSEGHVENDRLVCPWHGLALGKCGHGAWRPFETFDDGVLSWVRSESGVQVSDRPFTPTRPNTFLSGVIEMTGKCEPQDVIANRLDPWHGVHFHPHSFVTLSVIEQSLEAITVRVAYRITGPICMEVDARFSCSDPRTIVMTIVAGDGLGSVVATHATPVRAGVTRVIEETLATSQRPGFAQALRNTNRFSQKVLRPLIETRAARLWTEDLAYAERRYALRQQDAQRVGRAPRSRTLLRPRMS